MRALVVAIASAMLTLLAPAARADPFTGSYEIQSPTGEVTGFIDFDAAPMGTSAFNLDASFVTDFEIVVSAPGFPTLTFTSISDFSATGTMSFSVALGENKFLFPVAGSSASWEGIGSFGGDPSKDDLISLETLTFGTRWLARPDGDASQQRSRLSNAPMDTAWRLVLVPEPTSMALCTIGCGIVVWHKRRRSQVPRR